MTAYVRWFEEVGNTDVPVVGGKNASLGEMIRELASEGIRVPGGFAITVAGYRRFVDANDLDGVVVDALAAYRDGKAGLRVTGHTIREAFRAAPMPDDLVAAIRTAYTELSARHEVDAADVAVRSSATAEDLPDASFAGQQETFLAIHGIDAVVEATRKCFASLFTDRAISYREQRDFDHLEVSLSVGVQKMVRSDIGCAGTMFTLDTETGFPELVVIDASWGLGESVVGGIVTPDEYRAFKPLLDTASPVVDRRLGGKETMLVYAEDGHTERIPTPEEQRDQFVLTDAEVVELAQWATRIERHYGRPMDIEWARDGQSGELFVVQARPETVQSRRTHRTLQTWRLDETGDVLIEGIAVGHAIATGTVRVLRNPEDASSFQEGEILVTPMTDPDWVPLMEIAAGIVTDHGGRTSHAAIVSRELGVPAVVGTQNATRVLKDGMVVTISCAGGDRGQVYAGELKFSSEGIDMSELPETNTKIMMIVGNPDVAFRWWNVPCEGIGLARMEFIINQVIRAHPMALIHFDQVTDAAARAEIERLTRGFDKRTDYFVDRLARGMARIAASQYPHPVIVRMSDFKSNEYADLIGGRGFEPVENNPMLGFRGASRYYSPKYREGFALECEALKMAREELGFLNIVPMLPFVRTPKEADAVLEVMAEHGLVRGENGLECFVMIEVPSNVILAEEFAERFDGFSIGSNDLTQLTLGIDRDSADLAHVFDARDEAVKRLIAQTIEVAKRTGTKVGICGQAPSDHPEFAAFLVACGIDSIAVNPDSLVEVRKIVADAEATSGSAGS